MKTNIKNRILDFISDRGVTIAEFERNVALSNGYIKNFKGSIGSDKLSNIALYYPDLNIDWLLTGEGDMFKKSNKDYSAPNFGGKAIKYYPTVNGSMGGIQFLDNPDESFVDIIIPGFSDCEFAINAYGDSMYPVIKSGQVVLLMPWREKFIEWGRIYLVVTKSGYRTIKYIKPSKNDGCVLCESENKEESPAFEIEKDDILKMFLVKGWICKDAI